MADVSKPPISLLCKLGSIAVHAEEFLSEDRHEFDLVALRQLLADSDVKAWLRDMDRLAMLPKKRGG